MGFNSEERLGQLCYFGLTKEKSYTYEETPEKRL